VKTRATKLERRRGKGGGGGGGEVGQRPARGRFWTGAAVCVAVGWLVLMMGTLCRVSLGLHASELLNACIARWPELRTLLPSKGGFL
jgi:hypothetical protein